MRDARPFFSHALSRKRTWLRWAMPAALALTFAGTARAQSEADEPSINLPGQISSWIVRCWTPPRTDPPQAIEVTVRLSFSRAGAVIGAPRVTFVKAPAEPGMKQLVAASILAAVKACTPLKFTPSLGAAIAGQIFAIRFISLPVTGKQNDI
jgi:hypothetical protein